MKNKLLEIQCKLNVAKTQFNKFGGYKYRNHEDQCIAIKPLLKQYKVALTMTDRLVEIAGKVVIESSCTLHDVETDGVISRTSGYSGIDENRKGMTLEMSYGSASSYARKYAFNAMFLCDDNKDSDSTHDFDKSDKSSPQKADDSDWL